MSNKDYCHGCGMLRDELLGKCSYCVLFKDRKLLKEKLKEAEETNISLRWQHEELMTKKIEVRELRKERKGFLLQTIKNRKLKEKLKEAEKVITHLNCDYNIETVKTDCGHNTEYVHRDDCMKCKWLTQNNQTKGKE